MFRLGVVPNMSTRLLLITLVVSFAAKTQSIALYFDVVVTNTGTTCKVLVTFRGEGTTITTYYSGNVYGTEGFKNALQSARVALQTEFPPAHSVAKVTDADSYYAVTHVEPDGSKIGPFTLRGTAAIDADVMAATGKTFAQLCPFQSCFAAESTVTTTDGLMTMAEMYKSVGDVKVLTVGGHFSPLRFWLHAEPQKLAEFLRITTANGESLRLTRGHLVFKTSCDRLQRETVRAEKISPGDCLIVDNGDGHMQPLGVVKVDKFTSVGIYSPITVSGDLLVDNILASCYSEVEAVQLQSLMFDYVNIVKSVAKQLLSSDLFSAIFGAIESVAPLPEAVRQFLLLSTKFN